MKNIILLLVLANAFTSCNKKETLQIEENYVSYGESFDASKARDISDLSKLMNTTDSISITLSGEIAKTCAAKGCWMQIKNGQQNDLRVTFKDYSYFVPKSGVEGKKAIIKGYCIKQETSIEELKHYAKDAGESEEFISAITSPKMEYSFVADGVIIKD